MKLSTSKRLLCIFLIALSTLCMGSQSQASTTVPGGNVGGIWSVDSSPYQVISNIKVARNQKLRIEPGVVVQFAPGTGFTLLGTLLASGKDNNPIIFTVNTSEAVPGDWKGLLFSGTGAKGSQLKNIVVEYAETGIEYYNSRTSSLTDSVIRHNSEDGVLIKAKVIGCTGALVEPVITGCKIEHNLGNGIRYDASSNSSYSCTIPQTGLAGGKSKDNVIQYNSNNGVNIFSNNAPGKNKATPKIVNNLIAYNKGAGIRMGSGNSSRNGKYATISATISDNNIIKNLGVGISNGIRAGTTIFTKNLITGNTKGGLINYLSLAVSDNELQGGTPFPPTQILSRLELPEIISGFAFNGLDFNAITSDGKLYTLSQDGRKKGRAQVSLPCSHRNTPSGLAFDGRLLWVGDFPYIYKIDLSGNQVGKKLSSSRYNPEGLAFDGRHMWVSDMFSGKLYKLDIDGTVMKNIDAPTTSIVDLAFDGTHLWCTDNWNNTVYKITTAGEILETIPSPGQSPEGITFDGSHLWLASGQSNMIYKFDTNGVVISSFPTPGSVSGEPGAFNSSTLGLAFDGHNLWCSDGYTGGIYKLDSSGNVLTSFYLPDPCSFFDSSEKLAFDGTHNWTFFHNEKTLTKLDSTGDVLESFSTHVVHPKGMTFDGSSFWAIDGFDYNIKKLSNSGENLATFDNPLYSSYGLTYLDNALWSGKSYVLYKLDVDGTVLQSYDSEISLIGVELATNGNTIWTTDFAFLYTLRGILNGGEISGTLKTKNDLPLSDLQVQAHELSSGNTYMSSFTDQNGNYHLAVPPGKYRIKTINPGLSFKLYSEKWWDGTTGTDATENSTLEFVSWDEPLSDINFILEEIQPAPGDYNVDGNIDLKDAILLLKIAVGLPTPIAVTVSTDFDGDQKVTIADVVFILQKTTGLR